MADWTDPAALDAELNDLLLKRPRTYDQSAEIQRPPDLATRVARLEGQVDLLAKMLGHPATVAPTVPADPTPALAPEVTAAVRTAASGNRSLDRYLTGIALQMTRDGIEPELIARRIREGEVVE